jgi:hypothetical protein
VQYELVDPIDLGELPCHFKRFAENPSDLLRALNDAVNTTDVEGHRYALHRIQLRGNTGSIAATDGRQLLVHSGFDFPWDGDLLIGRTKVFGSRELPKGKPVAIGRTAPWLAIQVGPWSFYLRTDKEGRFPEVDAHVRPAREAISTLILSSADARFLAGSLDRLPGGDPLDGALTLDLDGTIAIRALGRQREQVTELVLRGSRVTGKALRVRTRGSYLERALRLGFERIHFFSPKAPVVCEDDRRRYVWALLSPDGAIPPCTQALQIPSPAPKENESDPPPDNTDLGDPCSAQSPG